MAKKDRVNAAYNLITKNQEDKKKDKNPEKVNPVGVALSKEELGYLEGIAGELGQSRHAVIQYAIKDFIKRYEQGERPKTKTKTVTILDP
jgi:hypothetical protein